MPYLTKLFRFCAAHQYNNSYWSDEKNEQVFGDDSKLHGHNYTLEVTLKGEPDSNTGFVYDLGKLKKIVQEKIINQMDHSVIEKDIQWFHNRQPSTENMVIWIWDQLIGEMENGLLHRLRLRETPTIYTDYYGPED